MQPTQWGKERLMMWLLGLGMVAVLLLQGWLVYRLRAHMTAIEQALVAHMTVQLAPRDDAAPELAAGMASADVMATRWSTRWSAQMDALTAVAERLGHQADVVDHTGSRIIVAADDLRCAVREGRATLTEAAHE